MRALYFIGSYSPDLMGNAGHEAVIQAMSRRGHEVAVLTQVNDPAQPAHSRTVYAGVPTYRINLAHAGGVPTKPLRFAAGRFLSYEHSFTLMSSLRRHLRANHYDLLHVEGAYPFGAVAVLAAGRTPYMVNVQGADVIDLPENDYGYRRYRLPRAAVRLSLDRAALVRVNSPFMVGYLVGERLAAPNRIVVVPRVLEDSAFPPGDPSLEAFRASSRRRLAEQYGVGSSRPVVMSLSRLHPFKGLEYLVDAVPAVVGALRERDLEAPVFLLCGPSRRTERYGDYRDFLRERAERLGVAHHIVFTGQVAHPEVRWHLAAADVVASPSIIEALHRVALEAAAVGTPTVITETTGAASYLAPHDACLSVPARDPQALAAGITDLLTQPALYESVSNNGMRVAETLRIEPVAEELEIAWLRAAAGRGAQAGSS